MRKCSLSQMDSLLAALAEQATVYLPVDGKDGRAHFTRYSEGVKLSSALNTVRSAKDFFFPQTENLMAFKMEGKSIEIIDTREESEDFILFGVRACDAKSFEVLDRVFLAEPVDSYYASRREHGLIITMACNRPAETCFCSTFGIDASEPKGDISCWCDEENIYLSAHTERGEKLMALLESCTASCEDTAADEVKELISQRLKKLPLATLTTEGFGAGKLHDLFEAPEWKNMSETCLGCGTCTFVCPTCQCYDIKDFDTGHGIKRFRCWDSCMYSDFTKMSAGQPRLTQMERFRQRFMHKLVYYPTNNDGLFMCVGCGRCLARCPISMNIVKVMKNLGGKKDE